MNRTTIIVTAFIAAVALGLALAGPVVAHGPEGYGHGGYGMHGQGMGYGHGPGMGYGYGPGANPDCPWGQTSVDRKLTVDDVTKDFERSLVARGNPNVKLGAVTEKDDKTIIVTIVTKDNSLVNKIEVDRATGRHNMVR
ncbi:MAG: hypothetical protein A3G18_02480 [Rhodospirillales bacterium RIFCSPLOWO2_12_FULL_58_28]|nr:MAG: hypothetical protein A3G18_02480 [Rhodospirillales bacterium RIFCSPLOWO2_12_FULL_58_28]